jgi:trehalose 6-phosphate synthase
MNFMDVIDRQMESKIDRERMSVIKNNHETLVRPYPISIDFENIRQKADSKEAEEVMDALIEEYKLFGLKVLIGLDWIDYTKGLPEKLLLALYRLSDVGIVSSLHDGMNFVTKEL